MKIFLELIINKMQVNTEKHLVFFGASREKHFKCFRIQKYLFSKTLSVILRAFLIHFKCHRSDTHVGDEVEDVQKSITYSFYYKLYSVLIYVKAKRKSLNTTQ